MSTVKLEDVKEWCRVIHAHDDGLLQRLINQSEDELLRYLNRTQPPTLPVDYPHEESSEDEPSSEDPAVKAFEKAVCILVQAYYEMPDPEKQNQMRSNAERVVAQYRIGLGA